MNDPDTKGDFVLFPKEGQWVILAGWDYSAVKIKAVDFANKRFLAHYLIPPRYGSRQLDCPPINPEEWISFESIEKTVRKFWHAPLIEAHEASLSEQASQSSQLTLPV